jgi:hypothetical protein
LAFHLLSSSITLSENLFFGLQGIGLATYRYLGRMEIRIIQMAGGRYAQGCADPAVPHGSAYWGSTGRAYASRWSARPSLTQTGARAAVTGDKHRQPGSNSGVPLLYVAYRRSVRCSPLPSEQVSLSLT